MSSTSRRGVALLVGVGLALSLAIAVFAAPWASSSPDGLERVAIDEGFDGEASDHALADTPAADYATAGWRALGVLVVFGVVAGLAAAFGHRRRGAVDSTA